MAENSKIEWTDSTFNPWWGCTEVSPACDNCYAKALDKRTGGNHWGPNAERRRTSPENWAQPLKWDRQAKERGIRLRVFCASMADVFDNQVPAEWCADLWELIRKTPNLDWQLLTKRPQNIKKMLPPDWGNGWHNVWLGQTVENRKTAGNIWHLLKVPAVVHFLSVEPLLESIDLTWCATPLNQSGVLNALTGESWIEQWWDEEGKKRTRDVVKKWPSKIDWVICGGESGPGARPMHPGWARQLRDQCAAAGTAFFFKQWGEWIEDPYLPSELAESLEIEGKYEFIPFDHHGSNGVHMARIGKKKSGRYLDDVIWSQFPQARSA